MPKEINQVILPDIDKKEEESIEQKVEERKSRKREEIEKLFVKHYGVEEGSDALQKLVDRELASAKSFDKLLKQKLKYRELALGSKEKDQKDDSGTQNDQEQKPSSSFDKLRQIEKSKATTEYLQGLVKKYPDRFKDKPALEEAYNKIMGEYKEKGDETRREDFKGNFDKAFKVAFPELYEEEIKAKERKRLLEDDVDINNIVNKPGGEHHKGDTRKFIPRTPKKDEIKDWLVGKK